MDYRRILSESEAICTIPDHWMEEVPFLMDYQNSIHIAFAYYCREEDDLAELKRIILIDLHTGEVRSTPIKDIFTQYPEIRLFFHCPVPNDYRTYLAEKDCYEELFASSLKEKPILDGPSAKQCEMLFKDIVSETAYKDLFGVISARRQLIE